MLTLDDPAPIKPENPIYRYQYPSLQFSQKNRPPNLNGPLYSFVASPLDMGFAIDFKDFPLNDDTTNLIAEAADATGLQFAKYLLNMTQNKINSTSQKKGVYCVARSCYNNLLTIGELPQVLNKTMFAVLLVYDNSNFPTDSGCEYFAFSQMYLTSMVGKIDKVDDKNIKAVTIDYGNGLYGRLFYNTVLEDNSDDNIPFGNNLLARALVSVKDMESFLECVTPPAIREEVQALRNNGLCKGLVSYIADKDVNLTKQATGEDYTQNENYLKQNILSENTSAAIVTDKVARIYYSMDAYAACAEDQMRDIFTVLGKQTRSGSRVEVNF